MISTHKAIRLFESQGADPVKLASTMCNLIAAGMLPADDRAPLTAHQLAALVIASTAPNPEHAAEHVEAYSALRIGPAVVGTFGEAIKAMLEAEPCNLNVLSVRVCQNHTAAILSKNNDVLEFGEGIGAFRNEVVISGSLIGALSMAMHRPTQSGWTGNGGVTWEGL